MTCLTWKSLGKVLEFESEKIVGTLHISVAPFVDVTALEIEVKGESTPLNVVLHPYATH